MTWRTLLAFLMAAPSLRREQEVPAVAIPSTREHELRSATNGRQYQLFISLPEGYAAGDTTRYPVLYVLDGNMSFPLATEAHRLLRVAGVPAVMLFTGKGSGDGRRDGSQVLREWLGTRHHTPRDAIGQGIDWSAGVTYARANFLIGYQVANQVERPRWKGSTFFRAADR